MTAPAPATEKAAPIPALLPCPFCGVDGSIEEGLPGHFMAICLSCYCNVGENVETATGAAKHMFESADEAAEAWNRRADRASQEERIREDERESCARIADDAARNAGASADRSDARTASGASVLAGYIFARTEAEAIAKAIRLRARLRGDAS